MQLTTEHWHTINIDNYMKYPVGLLRHTRVTVGLKFHYEIWKDSTPCLAWYARTLASHVNMESYACDILTNIAFFNIVIVVFQLKIQSQIEVLYD